MKQIRWIIILCVAFLFYSCSIGLVAVHEEPPFICFKKKCREMAKIGTKNGGNKQSYQKSKQIKARKKERLIKAEITNG